MESEMYRLKKIRNLESDMLTHGIIIYIAR